jgi:hypothetical protein
MPLTLTPSYNVAVRGFPQQVSAKSLRGQHLEGHGPLEKGEAGPVPRLSVRPVDFVVVSGQNLSVREPHNAVLLERNSANDRNDKVGVIRLSNVCFFW